MPIFHEVLFLLTRGGGEETIYVGTQFARKVLQGIQTLIWNKEVSSWEKKDTLWLRKFLNIQHLDHQQMWFSGFIVELYCPINSFKYRTGDVTRVMLKKRNLCLLS